MRVYCTVCVVGVGFLSSPLSTVVKTQCFTLPDTKKHALKIGLLPQKETHLPAIHFQVLLGMLVSGRVGVSDVRCFSFQLLRLYGEATVFHLRIVMPWHRRVHSIWVGNLPGKGEGKLTKRRKPWVVLSSNVEMDGNSPNWGVNSAKNKLVIYRV